MNALPSRLNIAGAYRRPKVAALTAAAALLPVSALLTGCGGPVEEATSDAVFMGNAEPAESPATSETGDPDGEVVAFDAVRDLDATGDTLGVRTENSLIIGTAEELARGGGATHDLDASCGDVSANAGSFAVACDGEVRVFGEREETIATDHPVTSATVTTTGEVLAGSDTERTVWLFRDGEEADAFSVARETDQLQAVPVAGQEDAVVRVCSFDTTIQDLDWTGSRQGGTLRVGLGVGKISAGDGTVLAADATGSQLLVYTTDDIIRLHQMAPVPEGPWDTAWDAQRELAWVTSTAENRLTGYDISQGVPLERQSLRTVANARSIASLDSGTLVLGSATGDGLQFLDPDNGASQ